MLNITTICWCRWFYMQKRKATVWLWISTVWPWISHIYVFDNTFRLYTNKCVYLSSHLLVHWSVWQLSLHVHDSAGQFIPVEACVKSELHPAHPKSFCPQVLLRAPGDKDWGEERALHGGDQSCQRWGAEEEGKGQAKHGDCKHEHYTCHFTELLPVTQGCVSSEYFFVNCVNSFYASTCGLLLYH